MGMLKFTPILLAILYALAMYRFSAWRTAKELDARSTELAALPQLDAHGTARRHHDAEVQARWRRMLPCRRRRRRDFNIAQLELDKAPRQLRVE